MTEQAGKIEIEISDNVHPNLDGSPWGWLVLKGTKIRVATYSGWEEKERCKTIVELIAGRTKTVEEKNQRIKELEDACLELLNAPHYEHFAVRLNDEEMAALNKIKILLNNKH